MPANSALSRVLTLALSHVRRASCNEPVPPCLTVGRAPLRHIKTGSSGSYRSTPTHRNSSETSSESKMRVPSEDAVWPQCSGRLAMKEGRALPRLAQKTRVYCLPVNLLFRRRTLHLVTVDCDFFARLLAFAGVGDGVWRLRSRGEGDERCYGESGGY